MSNLTNPIDPPNTHTPIPVPVSVQEEVKEQLGKHTPEPWVAADVTLETPSGQYIATFGNSMICDEIDFANNKRAAICVNSLTGISNTDLQSEAFRHFLRCYVESKKTS